MSSRLPPTEPFRSLEAAKRDLTKASRVDLVAHEDHRLFLTDLLSKLREIVDDIEIRYLDQR